MPLPERKPKGAREKSWYDFFNFRFGPFLLLIIWIFTADLEKASFYAPSPDECHQAALPLAKMATKIEDFLKVPDWVHDIAVSTDDVVTLGMVAVSYLDRIGMLSKMGPYFSGAAARMNNRMRENEQEKSSGAGQGVHNGQYDLRDIPIGLQHVPV